MPAAGTSFIVVPSQGNCNDVSADAVGCSLRQAMPAFGTRNTTRQTREQLSFRPLEKPPPRKDARFGLLDSGDPRRRLLRVCEVVEVASLPSRRQRLKGFFQPRLFAKLLS